MSTNISHDDLKRLLRSINQLKNAGYHDKLWLVDRSPFDNDDEPLTIIEKDSVRYIEVLLRLCPRSEPFNTSGFRTSLLIPIEFPLRPPKLRLITEIYHPNVGKEGLLCLPILRANDTWTSTTTLVQVLNEAIHYIDEPNLGEAQSQETANEYRNNRQLFNQKALEMISRDKVSRS